MSEHTPAGGEIPPSEPPQVVPRPPVADGIERQLDPRVVGIWRIGSAVFAGFLSLFSLVGSLILAFGSPFPGWIRFAMLPLGWLFFVSLLAAWAIFWPNVRYRHTRYRILTHGIEIKRGVIWRAVIQVPKSRVQHTDVSRGPVERAFDLATLIIYTAGTEHASVSLGGLEHGEAFRIRDHLIPGGGDDAV